MVPGIRPQPRDGIDRHDGALRRAHLAGGKFPHRHVDDLDGVGKRNQLVQRRRVDQDEFARLSRRFRHLDNPQFLRRRCRLAGLHTGSSGPVICPGAQAF